MMNFFSKIGAKYSLFLFLWFILMNLMFMYLMVNNNCYIMSWELLSYMSMTMEFDMVFDWISCSFSGLVCLISGCVSIFSDSYMKGDVNMKRFMMMLMMFVLSMNFLIFIPSLVSLILGWDGLGLVSFLLVIYYQNSNSLSAGMLTVLMNRIGDCFILMSVSLMVSMGHWNLMCMWEVKMMSFLMMFLVIAGMTKSAQIPFSSWLPAAMAAPTPVSALVHSSTLVTAGVFLVIRFYPSLMKVEMINEILMYVSIMTTLMSGMCAIYENDMKKIIALSTLSQLGVMMLSLSLKMPMLALFHLYTHAMFKALLFMCGGKIIHVFEGNQDIRCISGVGQKMPFTSLCMSVANMSLCGFPFLAGFYSKDLIIEKMLLSSSNMMMLLLSLVGVCMTLFYSMRMSMYMIWGGEMKTKYEKIKDNDINMNIPMVILMVGSLFGGYMFQMLFMVFDEEIFLPPMYKLMIIMLMMLSVLFSLSVWGVTKKKSKIYFFSFMSMKMWFMSMLVGYPLLKMMKVISNNNMKLIDMGWFEEIGGQGIMKMNKIIFKMMEHWMALLINLYMVVMIMYMVFI
uniref:NADH dehydrogenase subunit 5 n=1 Tax=Cirroctopus glacialis TaxID=202433 RepID=UPI0022FD9F4C|nr:NADH dehydrogenase subunit 5 [Cirroctopus glacialis]WAP91390.1 NADH dehydrogenase subunit 5 [Cirroctopus glacialis]